MTERIKVKFQVWDCELGLGTYGNGRTAIELVGTDSDCSGELVAVATVNVPEVELKDDEVLVKDYSENKGMLAALVGAGVVEPTGREVDSGFVKLPVCKLLVKKEDR